MGHSASTVLALWATAPTARLAGLAGGSVHCADQPVILRAGGGGEGEPPTAVAVGQAVAGVGERLLAARAAVPERALAQHRVVLGRDVEAEPECHMATSDRVVSDGVDLRDRCGGFRCQERRCAIH